MWSLLCLLFAVIWENEALRCRIASDGWDLSQLECLSVSENASVKSPSPPADRRWQLFGYNHLLEASHWIKGRRGVWQSLSAGPQPRHGGVWRSGRRHRTHHSSPLALSAPAGAPCHQQRGAAGRLPDHGVGNPAVLRFSLDSNRTCYYQRGAGVRNFRGGRGFLLFSSPEPPHSGAGAGPVLQLQVPDVS